MTATAAIKHLGARVWAVVSDTWSRYNRGHGGLLAAAVAFYSLLSLAPLIVIAVTVAGLVFDADQVRAALLNRVENAANADVANVLVRLLHAADKGGGRVAAVVALLTLLWAASRLFLELQEALNIMWGVRVKQAGSTRESIKRTAAKRLISFGMVLGSGTLLLATVLLQTLVAGIGSFIQRYLHIERIADALGSAEQVGVSLSVLLVSFAVIYRVLPDAHIRWRDVWIGAGLTAVLVLTGTWLLGLYLSHIAPAWLQGALGSIAVFMIWTFYLAQVFLLGSAFTRVWACRGGGRVRPEAHAELLPESSDEQGKPVPHAAGQRPGE